MQGSCSGMKVSRSEKRLQEQVEKTLQQILVLFSAENVLEPPICKGVYRPFSCFVLFHVHLSNVFNFPRKYIPTRPTNKNSDVKFLESQLFCGKTEIVFAEGVPFFGCDRIQLAASASCREPFFGRKPRFTPLDRTQLLPPASCRGQSRCFITFLRRRPFTDADRSAVWSASATVSGRFPPQNASDADVIDESSASFVERQEKERGLSRSL